MPLQTRLTVTDQFCGAGGSSQGAHMAGAEVFLAVNHWELAIETHSANFPDTLHDIANISDCNPRRYPSTTILLSSPSCTHHTYASGRRQPKRQRQLFEQQKIDPAAERSRATMWDVVRFTEYHQYEIVIVENVVEVRKWAPFDSWMGAMDALGYHGKVLYLNSMFFHPTPQSRDRIYIVFWKKGNKAPDLEFRPTAWCVRCEKNVESVQSWKNPAKQWGRWGRYGRQYVYRCSVCAEEVIPYYYAAFNVIDWSDLGERIGDRDRPLADKTIKRIEAGLEQYGNTGFLLDIIHTPRQERWGDMSWPLTVPARTQIGQTSHALLSSPLIVDLAYSRADNNRSRPASAPMPSQTTRQTAALVSLPFLTSVNYFRPDRSIDEPFPTQTTGNQYGVTTPGPFLVQLRNNMDARGVDEALSTVTASGNHHALVSPAPFLISYYGSNQMQDLEKAVATITPVDRHALVTPSELPRVEDCHFRMLQPHEVGRAMAFGDDYEVRGTKRQQVQQYGNAVTPPVMEWLLKRCIRTLL